jgi:hypothetical protein
VALSTSISGMSYEQVFDSPACARAALGGLFVLSCVHHFVLLYVFTSLVLCCDVRYDFLIKTMFGTSFLPFVCRRAHVLFILFVFVCVYGGVKHVLTLWATLRVSCKTQELLTLREHLVSPPMFCEVRVAHVFIFLCCIDLMFCVCFIFLCCID